jgi:hypothetical protein
VNYGTPAYGATMPSSQLNEYFLTQMKLWSKNEPADLVTEIYPVFRRLKSAGSIGSEPPGIELQEQFRYANPDRSTFLTRTNGIKQRDETPTEAYAGLRYDWVMPIQTLTVSMFDKETILKRDMDRFSKLLSKKRKTAINAENIVENDILWNGYVDEAGVVIHGLNDVIRFVNTVDPASGPVGGLSISTNPLWTNRSVNYNKAYKTVSSGYRVGTFLNDQTENDLLTLYNAMRNFEDGSFPDLIACNQVAYSMYEDLVRDQYLYRSAKEAEDLGVQAIQYMDSQVIFDSNVPDDPNTSTYGVSYLINTKQFEFVYGEGLRQMWGDLYEGEKTASNWDLKTILAIVWKNITQFAVFYGMKPAAVS